MARSAFVAVVGRPSVGKSTLVNALCDHKVSIVSPVPQTTRNAVRGVLTSSVGQLVFVDTPGIHDSDRRFNQKLRRLVQVALKDTDLVLYVLDASRPLGSEERGLWSALAKTGRPVIAAINKTDLAKPSADLLSSLAQALPAAAVRTISAQTGAGLAELVDQLFGQAAEGVAWYPAEYYTDQEPQFRSAELIREQVMNRTRDELPHATYVAVNDLVLQDSSGQSLTGPIDSQSLWEKPVTERPKLSIRAIICVERDSQKGILIGQAGGMIKAIRLGAEKELRTIFPYRIALDLRVKVQAKWRNDETLLNNLIR